MPQYYVNDNDQPSGKHEFYRDGCYWLTQVGFPVQVR